MKHLLNLALFSALFLFSACSSDDDPTSEDNSQKRLAQLTIKEYPYQFGEVSTKGELYEQYTYNEKGLLIHKTSCHKTPIEDIKRFMDDVEYTYDAEGHMIQKDELSFHSLEYRYKYTYNDIDSIAKEEKYNKDGLLYRTRTFEYDSNRRLIKEVERDGLTPTFGYNRVYSYEGNTVTCKSTRLKDGSLFGIEVHEYDSHKNLLKETWTGEDGKTTTQILNTFTYDANARITQSTHASMFLDNKEIKEYFYNDDNTIKKVILSYSYKQDKSELVYEYKYK